jgi:tetratricopeptide (TPR) repeat protein
MIVSALVFTACGITTFKVKHGIPFDLDKLFAYQPVADKKSEKALGIRMAKEGKFQDAIEAFTKYVLEQPEEFSGFNAIAVCYKNVGDHANAMKNFERALEFAEAPEDAAKVLANIGNLYFSANKAQVALGYYKEAATQSEQNPLYLILIGRTFIVLDEHDRARRALSAAEKIWRDVDKYEKDDERGLGAYLMAYSYCALAEEDKVIQYLEQALKANPGRYVVRLKKELSDPTSLLYTLKDNPRLEKTLRRHATQAALGRMSAGKT